MLIKIVLGIAIYLILVVFICIFLKGATKLANEIEEKEEIERIIEKLKKNKEKGRTEMS